MQIREIMSGPVKLVDPSAMIREAAVEMRDSDLGALPVGENDRLIGMVTDRDLVCRGLAADRDGGTTVVREVMSNKIYYCYEQDPVERASDIMSRHKVRRLPVINADKRLVGMVSLADLSQSGGEAAGEAEAALSEITQPSPHAPRR